MVTSLRFDQASAAMLADLIRGLWAIENSIHYVRDLTYREDHSTIRTGSGPRVMATLRNITIGLIRTLDTTSTIASTTRWLDHHLDQLIELLDHGQITTPSTMN